MSALRVLGIDPGLRGTGYGIIDVTTDRPTLVEAGIIATNVSWSLERRLASLYDGMLAIVSSSAPHAMVVEELYTTYKNPQTAVLMGHARGVIYLAAGQRGVEVHHLGHSLVKRALTGSGAARKEQVKKMVMNMLRLRTVPQPDDVSDALALALAFANVKSHDDRLGALRVAGAR